ncbi:MAG: inositol monophosphatase family protein [Methanomassiliicoccales archaeon]|jgi:fructose-1,6-bisphosphatase/inositol monophosphatase family enzyme
MRGILEKISKKVSEAICHIPQSSNIGEEIYMGADGTPTCRIDKVAEDIVLETLDDMKLPWNVLSEEAGFVDRGRDKTLVVDPIDGTHNALLGIPFYSVSLAVGTSSMCDVEAGLVRNLVTNEVFYAQKGKGAFRGTTRLHVRGYSVDGSAFLVYLGKYAHNDSMRVARIPARTRSLGCASLEMCMVAEGKLDAYYMNCEVHEKSIRVVDIAASALILREAGGKLVDLRGRDLDMPFDLKARSNFLAFGDPEVQKVIL